MSTATVSTTEDSVPGVDIGARRRWPVLLESLLILIGLGRLGWGQQVAVVADGRDRLASITTLLTTAKLDHSEYSLVGPLFSSPMWLLGKVLATPEIGASYFNLVVFTIGLGTLWSLLHGLVPAALIRRFMLLVIAACLIAPDVGHYGSETFTMMAVMVGIVALVRGRRRRAGWTAVVLGAINTPATLVGMGFVVLDELWRHRRLRLLLPIVFAGAGILLEILIRHGGYVNDRGSVDIMPFSGRPGFSYPIFFGVLGILFSFGRGLLYYIPGMFLPMRRALQDLDTPPGIDLARVHRLWLLFLAGLVLVYAPWWAWYAGMSWGPRFFLAGIMPAGLVLALRLGHRRASLPANLLTLAVLALSVWIGLNSLLWHELWTPVCYGTPRSVEALCWHTPEYSSLWYPLVSNQFRTLTAGQWLSVGYSVIVLAWLAAPLLRRIAGQIRDGWCTSVAAGPAADRWRW